jgi:hypothetical protein
VVAQSDQLDLLIEQAELRARAILTARWETVNQLTQAQIVIGQVDGDALAETLDN